MPVKPKRSRYQDRGFKSRPTHMGPAAGSGSDMNGTIELDYEEDTTYRFKVDTDRMIAWPAELSVEQQGETYSHGLRSMPPMVKVELRDWGFELQER